MTPSAYTARPLRPLRPALWHRLFWLPCWRGDNWIGLQQTLLLLSALAGLALWIVRPLPVSAAIWGCWTSTMLILLTDRGDKAVREQAALLRPVMAGWPLAARPLLLYASLFSLLPGAAILGLFGLLLNGVQAASGHSPAVAATWLSVAAIANGTLVAARLTPRGRVVLVALSILILSAIGSELWN